MTDKNDQELVIGAVYKVPRSEFKLKLIQRGEALFLQKLFTTEEFPIENFEAVDNGEKFCDIYRVE